MTPLITDNFGEHEINVKDTKAILKIFEIMVFAGICHKKRHNGLQLGEVADLEALTFNLALLFI
ncbi:MAG: hypothetical protein ACOYN4_09770 [Bacteroidales bacterium]